MTSSRRERLTVGVVPAAERGARQRLFDTLEELYPVRFVARNPGELRGLDGVVALGGVAADALRPLPPLPSLTAVGEETDDGQPLPLELADSATLARPLRGARLSEGRAGAGRSACPASSEDPGSAGVLAWLDGAPVWWVRRSGACAHHRVRVAPAELVEGEALRNRVTVGRSLAGLALTTFLRDLTESRRWQSPPLRAAFVIDDPNLRWPSYGHVNYERLRRNAAEHRYHVAIAMVPLDGWLTHPRMVRLFREAPAELSLTTHGNDHDGPEFGRVQSQAAAFAMATQALRRTASFARRTGLSVDPVMVPPHERLSEAASAALVAAGFEGFCHTRPFPWLSHSPDLAWLTRPSGTGPLLGWGSADVLPDGLPLLLRRAWDFPREDLVLRAYLGQPLILSGHHDLLEHGLCGFEEAAAQINRLGQVKWCSLGEIARSAAETRREGDVLHVRMLGRRIAHVVPAGVRELRIDVGAFAGTASSVTVQGPHGAMRIAVAEDGASAGAEVVRPGRYEFLLPSTEPVEAAVERAPRLRPLARRLASECRDRMRPVATKVGGR